TFQNDRGSFNATVFQTAIAAAAYHALGLPADDERLATAIEWLRDQQDSPQGPDTDSVTFHGFWTTVWTTALTLRAMLCAGVSRRDPRVNRAVQWFAEAQVQVELPALVPSKPGAPRRGGWAFERDNHTVPDSDDTAVVLGVLGLALQFDGDDRLDPAIEA